MFFGLFGTKARRWFQTQETDPTSLRETTRWTLAMVTVSAITAIGNEVKDRSIQKTVDSTFMMDTTFSGVDAADGKPVSIWTISPQTEVSPFYLESPYRRFYPSTSRVQNTGDGHQTISLSTILTSPRTYKIEAQGMKPVFYTVDAQTPSQVSIRFEKDGTTHK
ncbi:MAG: hypothetical protein QM755_01890 [Luteolibacter sp.]